jgi:hypothetical protein
MKITKRKVKKIHAQGLMVPHVLQLIALLEFHRHLVTISEILMDYEDENYGKRPSV